MVPRPPAPLYISGVSFHWSPTRMDQLERAARGGKRLALMRRGSEHVLIPRPPETSARGERLIGFLTMSGQEMAFELDQVESFEVVS